MTEKKIPAPAKKKAAPRKAEVQLVELSTLRPGDTRIVARDGEAVTEVLNFYRKSYLAEKRAELDTQIAAAQGYIADERTNASTTGPIFTSTIFDPQETHLFPVATEAYLRGIMKRISDHLNRFGDLYPSETEGYVGIWELQHFDNPEDATHVYETAAEIAELLRQLEPTDGDGVEG